MTIYIKLWHTSNQEAAKLMSGPIEKTKLIELGQGPILTLIFNDKTAKNSNEVT